MNEFCKSVDIAYDAVTTKLGDLFFWTICSKTATLSYFLTLANPWSSVDNFGYKETSFVLHILALKNQLRLSTSNQTRSHGVP